MSNTLFSKVGVWAYGLYTTIFRNGKRVSWSVKVIWGLLVFSAVRALFTEQYAVTFVSVSTLLLTVVPYIFARRYRFYIPPSFMTLIVLFLYAAIFLGESQNFYAKFWWWDVVLHTGSAVGFGLIGMVILLLLFDTDKAKAPPFIVCLLAFMFAIGIGAMWEVFEFSMDQIFGFNMQKNGLRDTMWDLIVDGIGALFASTVGYVYIKGKQVFGLGYFRSLIEEMIKRNQ